MVENLRNRIIRFMYGRYGNDQLNKALLVAGLVFIILGFFIKSSVISGIILLILIVTNVRALSKNIYKRQGENRQYQKLAAVVKKEYGLLLRRVREGKAYSFHKCPNCHQVLRLKRKRGSHKTLCPKCQTKMRVRIWF